MLPTPSRSAAACARTASLLLAGALLVAPANASASPAADPPSAPEVSAAPRAGAVGLLPARRPRAEIETVTGRSREVGMRFRPKVAGAVVGLRFYKPVRSRGATPKAATLWAADGTVLARSAVARTKKRGWRAITFDSPVSLAVGSRYVVSVHTRKAGVHAATRRGFDKARSTAYLHAPSRRNGVVRGGRAPSFPTRAADRGTNYWVDVRFVPGASGTTTTTTTTTTTPPPPPPTNEAFPGPDNTGVPPGTALTPYTGPCTINAPTTLNAVDATGSCDAIVVATRDVVITNSRVPRVESTLSLTGGGFSSVRVEDSEVRAGAWSDGALWGYNITASRVDVTGGQHSFHCNDNCVLTDSWLHDQYNPASESYHNNAFISNGGTHMVLRHNTLHCTAILNSNDGGCTADVSLFGDFGPISDVTVDNNLLKANGSSISYCAYGGYSPSKPHPVATGIVFTNNVFERGDNGKCGVYGAVTAFQRGAAGNVWTGNVWSTGEAVNP